MYKIDYLLRYISNDCYNKILNKSNKYILNGLEHSRIDVDLNIRYLINLGVSNIDAVVYDRLEDLIKSHNDFIGMMNKYINKMGKDSFISMIENL